MAVRLFRLQADRQLAAVGPEFNLIAEGDVLGQLAARLALSLADIAQLPERGAGVRAESPLADVLSMPAYPQNCQGAGNRQLAA